MAETVPEIYPIYSTSLYFPLQRVVIFEEHVYSDIIKIDFRKIKEIKFWFLVGQRVIFHL